MSPGPVGCSACSSQLPSSAPDIHSKTMHRMQVIPRVPGASASLFRGSFQVNTSVSAANHHEINILALPTIQRPSSERLEVALKHAGSLTILL